MSAISPRCMMIERRPRRMVRWRRVVEKPEHEHIPARRRPRPLRGKRDRSYSRPHRKERVAVENRSEGMSRRLLSPERALLTMPDLTRLETTLRDRFPERWVRHHLDSFSAAYFEAFDAEDVARHLGLVRELDDEHLVFARAWPVEAVAVADADAGAGAGTEEDRWWVEVVGYDAFQFLSTLCNLLAVHGLSIVEGRV